MGKEYRSSRMETFTRVVTKTENLMAKASTIGVTEVHTRDSSRTDCGTAREYGENPTNPIQILTTASFWIKKSKVMEFLYGPMEASISEILSTMFAKVTVRCIGATALSTKASGTMEPRSRKYKIPILTLISIASHMI